MNAIEILELVERFHVVLPIVVTPINVYIKFSLYLALFRIDYHQISNNDTRIKMAENN